MSLATLRLKTYKGKSHSGLPTVVVDSQRVAEVVVRRSRKSTRLPQMLALAARMSSQLAAEPEQPVVTDDSGTNRVPHEEHSQ